MTEHSSELHTRMNEKARWSTVLAAPESQGTRAKLAQTMLLSTTMSAPEIIAALKHVPTGEAATAAAATRGAQEPDPAFAAFSNPQSKGGIFDSDLYAAGEAAAKWLLCK